MTLVSQNIHNNFFLQDTNNSDEESDTEAESVPVSPVINTQSNKPQTRTPSPKKTGGPVFIKPREQQMQELVSSVFSFAVIQKYLILSLFTPR